MPAVIAFRAGDQERVRRKLDAKYLVEPEFDEIFNTSFKRVQTGKNAKFRSSLTARRNMISGHKEGRLAFRIESTPLVSGWKKPRPKNPRGRGTGSPRPGWQEKIPNYNPRRTGHAWNVYNVGVIVKNILPRSVAKAIRNIEARWAAN